MAETAVGHGTPGSYECLPGEQARDPRDPARRPALRLAPARARRPQGAGRPRLDVHSGHEVARLTPGSPARATATAIVFRSYVPAGQLPEDPTGHVVVRDVHASAVSSSALRKFEACVEGLTSAATAMARRRRGEIDPAARGSQRAERACARSSKPSERRRRGTGAACTAMPARKNVAVPPEVERAGAAAVAPSRGRCRRRRAR